MIEVYGLTTGYGRLRVLEHFDFLVPEASSVAVLGANGAGKSTLLKACSRSFPIWNGVIILDGRDVTHWSASKLAKAGVCYVPEGGGFFGSLTVKDNLDLARYSLRQREVERRRVLDLFPRLGERQSQIAGTLSGGEKRMLALARALLARPRLLLIDEPSLGLSPVLVNEVFDVLRKLKYEDGVSLVIVEQYAEKALALCEYAWVLAKGEPTYRGSAEELHNGEVLKRAYLALEEVEVKRK